MNEPIEESHEADARSAEAVVSEVDTLPNRLGFVENAELQTAHRDIVIAVQAGNNAEGTSALHRYLDAAERFVDTKTDTGSERARAQVGLIVAQALIWRESDEQVKYLRTVLSAHEYALNMGFEDVLPVLAVEISAAINTGELLQAKDEFDEAVSAYIELEQADLDDKTRGLLNLRMAECYQELIEVESSHAVFLEELRDGSMESALLYLEGEPEQVKALAFQDTLSK